ncbi:hypothetical protein R70211_05374 [Paraburkholderia domus]|uniref:Uncharacterized protein n=1 Tax=Paraburkholderia domus TaxID=2793075 RepID=A0A9N8N1M7_9BURK|nr:hypothetical protein R70211_05374 [Paraburkholderia domus]
MNPLWVLLNACMSGWAHSKLVFAGHPYYSRGFKAYGSCGLLR